MINGRLIHLILTAGIIITLFLPLKATDEKKAEEKYQKAGRLVDKGHYKKAIHQYRVFLDENPNISGYLRSRTYNNLGFCFYKLKKYHQAYLQYSRALIVDKDYLGCLNNISAALIKQKKFQPALKFLDRAYRLDKRNLKVVFNLFVVYANLKLKDKCSLYLREAYVIDKAYTRARLRRKGISSKKITRIEKELFNRL